MLVDRFLCRYITSPLFFLFPLGEVYFGKLVDNLDRHQSITL
jgi:hypothetical protein